MDRVTGTWVEAEGHRDAISTDGTTAVSSTFLPMEILQGLSEGITVLDAEGNLLFANELAARLAGYADLASMRAAGVHSVLSRFRLFDEAGNAVRPEEVPEAARAGQTVERVLRIVPAWTEPGGGVDGAGGRARAEERWISVRATPMRSASGAVDRVIKLIRDITERKRGESWQRFLAEATSILAGSLEEQHTLESVMRLAAGSVADCCAIDVADREGRVQCLALAECADDAGDGLRRRWQDMSAAERLGASEALRTGRSQLLPEGLGLPEAQRPGAQAALGALGLQSLMSVPLVTRGLVLGVVTLGSMRRRYGPSDLGEAESLAHRIAVAIDNARLFADAQEAVRSREDLLAVVSHDLRNPLGVVLASSALLLRAGGSDPEQSARARRQLDAIQRAANRMNRLIRDLLDFASIQGGRLAITRRPQDAAALVCEALEALEPLAAEKQLRLSRGPALAERQVSCDRDRMLQVFSNVVGNAIKFTPEGGAITVEAVDLEDRVRFSVADSGPGILPNELGHVFDRYWQARRRNREGIGLGLAIAKGIIEAHGGAIWVESGGGGGGGGGATFFFTLPLHAP